MSVRSGQSITIDFATCRFDTGAATAADSLPTGTLVVNGTDDAATVTITSKTGGKYKAAVTLPTLAIGDVVQIRIAATVNSVAGIGVAWTDSKDVLLDANGKTTDSVQTGDTYALANGANGFVAIAGYLDSEIAGLVSDMATVLSRLSSARAGYLDKLNISGDVAGSSEVTAIQNNTTTELIVPTNIIRPASGSVLCYFRVYLKDTDGNMEAPDAAPTIDIRDQAGNDLSGRLNSATGTLEATGQYRWTYTSTSTDDAEQLLVEVTVIEGGVTRKSGRTAWITDNASTDFTSSDRADLLLIKGYVDELETRLTALRAGYLDSIPAIVADTNELQTDWSNGGRLDLLLDAAAASSAGGTGARSVTITVNDGSTVLQNALVRMTNGAESYVIATNVSGVAVFALDDATWSVTVTKGGYQFTPTTIVVNGTETATYSMTQVTITPSEPDQTTGWLVVRKPDGTVVEEADVTIEILRLANGVTGEAIDDARTTQKTDPNGLVQFTGLPRGAAYRINVNGARWFSGTTLDADETPLRWVVGEA